MINKNCETIQRQIEETARGENYDADVRQHLRSCHSCEQFEKDQSSLRQLVGSLGIVQAPPDFDFKLRARLANQSSGRFFRFHVNPLVATFATLILFAAIIASVSYVRRPKSQPPVIATEVVPSTPTTKPVSGAPVVSTPEVKKNDDVVAEKREVEPKRSERPAIAVKPKRSLATADFSSTQAQTFGSTNVVSPSTIFPIDASTQPMKVSLDDSRGNARTISLPGVSFGSQRVVTGNQLAAKSVW